MTEAPPSKISSEDQHPNIPSVDQSDRLVPINLRQSGPTPVELLISTRVRKSPFWHLSVAAGAWRATIYNRTYHPRGYLKDEDGGTMAEYEALVNRVTLWDVSVERQIRVRGPDAEDFVNFVITRNASKIKPLSGRYCILCNEKGGVLNDPVLLRLSEDEFWFSLSDSDLMLWLQGVNVGRRFDVDIAEIDVCPLQIQGPRSEDLMADLVGDGVRAIPYYGLLESTIGGASILVSQSGFTGEKGYEIYVRNASENAEIVWNAVLAEGKKHELQVIAPAHHRRIAAGILSWGQDMDFETSPFQVNLGYQIPCKKKADYIGKQELECQRTEIDAGRFPFKLKMVGLKFGGKPVIDYANDFWLIATPAGERVGYVTSPWWSPELKTNIALGHVPIELSELGTALSIEVPERYAETPGQAVAAEVSEVPFRPSINPSAREAAKAKGRDHAE
ncbi:MAG: glycine cleavage T C-terminal barrel domain-containing protein [Myxococcota bacterium]